MNMCKEMETVLQLHTSLTTALNGIEWSASCFMHFTPGERASNIIWKGDWVGTSNGLDIVTEEKVLAFVKAELLSSKM
jgi:hypothetical protein